MENRRKTGSWPEGLKEQENENPVTTLHDDMTSCPHAPYRAPEYFCQADRQEEALEIYEWFTSMATQIVELTHQGQKDKSFVTDEQVRTEQVGVLSGA
jgi:hypothetical protein